MARFKDLNSISGALGPVIFYTVNGKMYIRTKPAKVRQPNTPAQMDARDKFRESALLASNLHKSHPLLGLDEEENRSKSGYHEMLGHLRRGEFQEGVTPARWVWEKLAFRDGIPPEITTRLQHVKDGTRVEWEWEETTAQQRVFVALSIDTVTLKTYAVESPIMDHSLFLYHPFYYYRNPVALYAVIITYRKKKPNTSGVVFLGMLEDSPDYLKEENDS